MNNKSRLAVTLPLILLLFLTLFQSHAATLEGGGQFLAAYRVNPWRHDLLEKAAFARLEAQDINGAIPLFEQAREKNSLTVTGQQALAEAYLQVGQPGPALSEWQDLYDRGLRDSQTLLQLARLYHQRGEFERERQIAQAGIQSEPDLAEFHWRLALIKMAESPLEAIPVLERLQALDPEPVYRADELIIALDRASLVDSLPYHLAASARILASIGEWDLAQAALERAVAADPEYALAWGLLGEIRQQTGRGDALAALERALWLEPASALNRIHLGLYWQRRGEYDKASQQFAEAARLEPRNPLWLVNLGQLSLLQGNVMQAQDYHLRATQAAPQDAFAWRSLALFCLQTESCLADETLRAAQTAYRLDLDDWQNADALGQVFVARGDSQSALTFLSRAVELAPAEAAPRFHLGLLHLRNGDASLARQTLQEALALDPDGPLADTIRSVIERYLP
jgi:tetratricopeptide (TPR) repeat protein